MVQRANAGREPEVHRRVERQLGVVDDPSHEEAWIAHAHLVAGIVGVAGARRELGDRECRGDCDVGESVVA